MHSQAQVEALFRAIGVSYLLLRHCSLDTEPKRIIPLVSEAFGTSGSAQLHAEGATERMRGQQVA